MADPKQSEDAVQTVPVELQPPERAQPPQKDAGGKGSFFHPYSGMAILGIDWLAFGIDLPTEMLITPIVSVLAFVVTFWMVYRFQIDRGGDTPAAARWKAFLGGAAAGVPFPVTGTILGAWILLMSGLPTTTKHPSEWLRPGGSPPIK